MHKGKIALCISLLLTLANKPKTMWPALILATNRTVNVKGRIRMLMLSTSTRKGSRARGAPLGARCAKEAIGEYTYPDANNNIQNKTLRLLTTNKSLVRVYVNGVNPKTLLITKNKNTLMALVGSI